MKNTTHFKIENKRQLELLYEDFKDDLPINWKELLERFDNGTRTFQKNSIGLVNFNDDILQQSTAIKNPLKHPQQKLKPRQQTFFAFCNDINHPDKRKTNQIHYKGKKMYRFIAWRKFLSYFRMLQDPDIKIITVDNKLIQSKRHGAN